MEKKKTKILYAASTVSHLNNFHKDYIKALRDMGCEVKLMANGESVDYNIPFEKQILSKKNRISRKMIRDILDKEKFDVIIANTSLAALHIRLAAKRKNRPRIVNFVHGYLFSENSGFVKKTVYLWCEKILKKKTDAIIVMNREDEIIAKSHKLTSGEVYFVRGMGVDEMRASKDASRIRSEEGAEGSFVLFFAGELSKRKNQVFLVEAMKDVSENIPNAVLWLAGEGQEREALRCMIEELSLGDKVKLLGYRRDVANLLSAADLYVTASKSEGLPFNVVEALSAGKMVVASSVKGHTDVIENGASGFLYSAGSREEFLSIIKKIHSGELSLEPLAIKERYDYYSKEKVFEETLGIIKSAALLEEKE